MNNNIYVFLGSLIVIISILISFFSSKFKQIEKDNIILKKEIYYLKKNSIENNIENFTDTYNTETIKAHVIEQVNKIYDIDVDAIRNLGAISKSLLTGKNYHKHTDGTGDPGTLTIPANVVIEGTLQVGSGPKMVGTKDTYEIGPDSDQCIRIHTPPNSQTRLWIINKVLGAELYLRGESNTDNPKTAVLHKNSGSLFITGNNTNASRAGLRIETDEKVFITKSLTVNNSIDFGKGGINPATINSSNFVLTATTIDFGKNGNPMNHFKFWLKDQLGIFRVHSNLKAVMSIETDTRSEQGGDRIAFGRQVQKTSSEKTAALEIFTRTGHGAGNEYNLVILDTTALRNDFLAMNAKDKDGWLNTMVTDPEGREYFNTPRWEGASATGTMLHIPGTQSKSIYWRQGLTMKNWSLVKDNSWEYN